MAEVIRYVDPDATGSADGTSWTDAYTSLNSWEAAEQTDLVTDGDTHTVYCRSSNGTEDTTAVNISGWTVDNTHYVTVEVPSEYRHDGKWDTNAYILHQGTGGETILLRVVEEYTIINGLQVKNESGHGISPYYTGYIKILNTIVKDCSWNGGIRIYSAGSTVIANCIIYNNSDYGIYKDTNGAHLGSNTHYIYNCTVCNNDGYGLQCSSYRSFVVKNTYAGNNTTADYGTNGGWTLTTCYSSDGSQSTTTAAYSTTSGAYFTNLTSGSEDFHIQSSSALIGNGTDLSSDSVYAFSDDIDGDTRGTDWDVGADEYVSSGTSVTVSLSDLAGTGTINASTVSGDALKVLSLLQGIGAVNALSVSGSASISLSQLLSNGTINGVGISGGANVSLNLLSGSGTLYAVSVSTGGNITVALNNILGSGILHPVSVLYDSTINLNTLTGYGNLNNLSVSGDANVLLNKLDSSGEIYSVTVQSGGTIITLSPITGTGGLYSVTVDTVFNNAISLPLIRGHGELGSLIVGIVLPKEAVINPEGLRLSECMENYSLRIVEAKEAAEADGGIDRITYYEYIITIYSKNGNKWIIDWDC